MKTPLNESIDIEIGTEIETTPERAIKSDGTELHVEATHFVESDYSDIQFYTDLEKANERLDSMAARALKEHRQGKTREFPT